MLISSLSVRPPPRFPPRLRLKEGLPPELPGRLPPRNGGRLPYEGRAPGRAESEPPDRAGGRVPYEGRDPVRTGGLLPKVGLNEPVPLKGERGLVGLPEGFDPLFDDF